MDLSCFWSEPVQTPILGGEVVTTSDWLL